MRISLFYKFLAVVLLVSLIVGSMGFYLSILQQKRLSENFYFKFATSIAKSIDAGISEEDLINKEGLKAKLYKLLLLNPDILSISVNLGQDENLIEYVSTDENQFSLSNNYDLNQKAYRENANLYQRGNYNNIDSLDVIVPLHLSGNVSGTYSIKVSLEDLRESNTQQVKNTILLILISLLIIILSVTLLIRFTIFNPLKKLTSITRSIEEGNFDIQIESKNNDEISDLFKVFAQMADRLKLSYEVLEERVKEKTKALSSLLSDAEIKNNTLKNNKVAMLNLLEDSKILEDELKIQKESVEKQVVERTMELGEEKSKLTSAIEALNKALVMIGLSGDIILVNNNLNKVFNEEKINWSLSDIQNHLGTCFDFVKAYNKTLEEKKNVIYDDIAFGSRVLQIRFNPVFGEKVGKKEMLGVLAIIGDVTDEKALARSRDEFFSIASHELRTPLTAIRGNTSMILDYYKDAIKDPDLKLMVTDMHDASLRLIGIVNDFLDMSRLEQGRMVYKITEVKLKEIVDGVVKDLEATVKEKGIALTANIDEKTAVKVDSDKLKQVLFNMIGNSIKFTEKGGVSVVSEVKNDFVYVRIVDTGKGIPVANQSLLFRKFQQAGKSTITRDGAKGTGLGLYISKLLVEGMGGTITLEKSEEGKGSTFTFTLPVAIL